jgi:indole-3-glycerol phosphate synthase
MRGSRRFSQAISEGDGISLIADVEDAESARAAEADGAEGIVLRREVPAVREATELPILFLAGATPEAAARAGADACLVDVNGLEDEDGRLERAYADVVERGLDCAVAVHDEDELRLALDRLDPEILVLSARRAERHGGLEHVLGLLPDVPAGKLAVAVLDVTLRDEVVELERAGIDAVVVAGRDVGSFVGEPVPEP